MICCIPGFLGTSSDWSMLPFTHTSLDLFNTPSLPQSLDAWAPYLISLYPQNETERIIIGYSLGGRIALHVLCAYPDFFSKAIIISAHIGLPDIADRKERIETDEQWARRFEQDEWQSVIAAWNAQPVFNGDQRAYNESSYDRSLLAKALRCWSLGTQEDLTSKLLNIQSDVLWIVGEQDSKFLSIGNHAVSLLKNGSLWACPHAGHRAPWQQPHQCIEKIENFLFR